MSISRRNFIHAGTSAAIAATLLGSVPNLLGQSVRHGGLYAIPPASTLDPLNYLVVEHFTPFVGTTMRARMGRTASVNFNLLAATSTTRTANQSRGYNGTSYSLLFGASARQVPSGNYTFAHSTLGEFSLLINSVDDRRGHYEAIVNRIKKDQAGSLD